MIQKTFPEISAKLFTANGTSNGVVTVANSLLFKVGQIVNLFSDVIQPIQVEVKFIGTATTLEVGDPNKSLEDRKDLSSFLTSDNASISANSQTRPAISMEDVIRSVWDESPVVGLRTSLVDELGNKYNASNPVPVILESEIIIENANIDVSISAVDNDLNPTHSSVRLGDGTTEVGVTLSNELKVSDSLVRSLLTSINTVQTNGTQQTQVTNFPLTFGVTQSTSPWIISGAISFTSPQHVIVDSGSIAVSNFPVTQAVTQSGPWTVSLETESIEIGTVDQGTPNSLLNAWPVKPTDGTNFQSYTGSNEAKVSVTQPLPAGTNNIGSVDSIQSGVWNTGRTWVLSNITDSVDIGNFPSTFGVTQGTSPWVVSGTVTSNIGTTGGLALDSTVSGLLTNTQLRASPVPVSGTITANQGTNPWIISGSIAFTSPQHVIVDSGTIAISNFPISVDTSYGAVGASTLRSAAQIGNATGAAAFGAGATTAQVLRVVLPTDQSSIPVTINSDSLPATQNITVQDTGSTTTSYANSQNFITGTPTAGSVASFSVSSLESVEVQVTGTWTGTLQTEFSIDGGVTWFTRGIKQAGISYISSSFTSNFAGGANIAGATNYRIRATAAMTGTATVRIVASINPTSINVTNALVLRDSVTQSNLSTVTSTGDLRVNDGIRSGGVYSNLSLPTANTAVEVKVGGSRLTNRKLVTVIPTDADMYWGYDSSVTTSNGTPIFKNQFVAFDMANDATQIWLVCSTNTRNARITEAT